MKKSTKIRLSLLILVGILLGFLAEVFLTILDNWASTAIISSTIDVFISICGIAICGVVFIFSYLGIVKHDDKWSIRGYFYSFIFYDVMVILGGVTGKFVLQLFIN
ncbi:hypothetical protein AKUH3B101J_14760 [Apilactobacillus kunkeei]|uniref:hypothetical protein n=1 Tax=Apilactobacillus kunkeei TaxID=148814 RepID=UPI00200B7FD9|nr:hypothetical protein [Apilactobacillus kunkeei]MCK8625643.1 hypothetical protein [Apilactobacillus kunkeei]CAI2666897.1 hypothetical protein AKUH3B109M_14360 [Apilactobacillus kunkeei]CAI2668215.1 hypothetical protein AKUH3B104J_14770 [Apilactobacillus kunkeei]CAI2671455.1 hypothetical protein AKUH3B101J_14760 [Apilactobacillus kunkeei]CAI2672235.1 hypothetical protein AKUH3B205J_15020 [Apilactobacillus kunkeei]